MRFLRYLFFLSILFLILSSYIFAGFIVTPMKIEELIKDDNDKTYSMWIRNNGEEPLTLKLYTSDYYLLPDGSDVFDTTQTVNRSCIKWINLSKDMVEVQPNEDVNIKFQVKIPKGISGTYWGMIFLEQTTNPEVKKQKEENRLFSISAYQRIGVRVILTAADTDIKKAVIEKVDVNYVPETGFIVNTDFFNQGNVILSAKGKVEVRNLYGDIVFNKDIDKFRCYPDTHRVLNTNISDKLDKGSYSVLSILDYGETDLIAGEAVIEIK